MTTVIQTQPNLPAHLPAATPPRSPKLVDSPAVSPGSTASDTTQIQTSSPSVVSDSSVAKVSTSDKPVKVIVVSDMICPWCYIAFASINRAISELTLSLLPKTAPKFEIEFRPFPLLQHLGSDDVAIDKKAHMEKRFGKERAAEMAEAMLKRGRELGIEFKLGGLMRQTTRVHRLLALAYQRGGMSLQQSLLSHLFRAYFEEEKDIGSPELLAHYADEVGLMNKEIAEQWIRSKAGEEDVKAKYAISSGCGITGVPFVVINGKWAISGGQPEGEYFRIFEKIAKGEMA